MPSPRLSTEGFLLSKEVAGESYQRYQIFSQGEGLLLCLQRFSTKKTPKVQPDLFDRAQIDLEKPQSGIAWFLRDYRIISRHNGLAGNYKTFLLASEFAALLLKNLSHVETFEKLFSLTAIALESWEKGYNPEVVLLKTLYLFARHEGYPVKEDWWRNLPPNERAQATRILNKKIESLNFDEDVPGSLLNNIKEWITRETDILL